jgi:hypothetical protein
MGGSGGNAAKEQQRAEEQRQAQIKATQRRIESTFATPEREADIASFLDATRQFYTQDANRQQGDASRNLRFALARSGQTGGQLQADQGGRLFETYQRGLLEADRRAQAAASDLRASDQQAKTNLFGLAASGLDATTAAQNASQALRSNLSGAKASATEGSLGDLFGSFGDVYKSSIEQQEKNRAQRDVYSTLYAPRTNAGGGFTGGGY